MAVACTIDVHYFSSNIALALARSVSYGRKVRFTLKRTFTNVNYGPKMFIVQAAD
jgi:hypothetical protein